MTKKLEELLNLSESQEIVQEEQANEAQDKQQEQKANQYKHKKTQCVILQSLTRLRRHCPKVDGLGEMGDTELDDIQIEPALHMKI